MKTDPQDTAFRKSTPWGWTSKVPRSAGADVEGTVPPTTPQASDANATYAGALSRKLDSIPEPQKNCQGWFIRIAPERPISSSSSVAGPIVRKIPMGPATLLLERSEEHTSE